MVIVTFHRREGEGSAPLFGVFPGILPPSVINLPKKSYKCPDMMIRTGEADRATAIVALLPVTVSSDVTFSSKRHVFQCTIYGSYLG